MTNTLNKIIHNGDEYLIPSGEVGVSDQAGNIFTTGMKIWGGTQSDFNQLTQDSNTAYLLLADQPTPPSPGRQPGANTVLYVPMSTDLLDHSSNQFTLTNNGVSLVSSQADIDVGYFNGSSYLSGLNDALFNFGDFHLGVWLNIAQLSHDRFIMAGISNGDVFIGYGNSDKFGVGRNGVTWDNSYYQSLTTGTWYYVSFDRSGTSFSVSVNTSTIGTGTNSQTYVTSGGYQIGNDGAGNYINGYMSDLILENKSWTSQEISDYYDQTKGDYGIS